MRRNLMLAAAAVALLGLWGWWLLGRAGAPRADSAPALSRGPAVNPVADAPLALPRLTVRAADAGLEVKLRGARAEPGCATGGTAEPLCPGEYDVRAVSGDKLALAVVRLNRGDHRELDLTLEKASTLELTVLDDDKLPVDRATVIAQHARTGYLLKGRSDSDGTVSLGPAASGDWLVLAQRDGWAPGATTATAGRSATVRLGNVGWVEGTLQPAAAAARFELRTTDHVVVVSGATTDGGVFRLGPVPHGKYELALADDDFEPGSQTITVPSSAVAVRALDGATLKGDLLGPNRERLSGTVTLDGPLGRHRTVTARDGAFVAHALSPGRWRLASAEGRAVTFIDGGVSRIELIVPKFDGVISGTCAFDGGHRLPSQVIVSATWEDDVKEIVPGAPHPWGGSPEDRARTVSASCTEGRFELTGLPRGFYALAVEAREGLERYTADVGSACTGTRDLNVSVPGVAWLAYRLVDEGGATLEPEQRREHFESRDLELQLQAKGFVPATRTASLDKGRDTLLGDVALKRGLRLTGRVLDAVTKDPVPGATVSVGGFEQRTGPDGTFVSLEAPARDVEIRTSHPRYVSDVRAAAPTEELNIELQHAARAVGALITADGVAPKDVEVWAISSGTTLRMPVVGGTFATPHLKDGRWLLRVMPAAPGTDVSAFDTHELEIKGPSDRPVSLIERLAGLTFEVQIVDRVGAPAPSDVLLVPRKEGAPGDDQVFARLLRQPALVGGPTSAAARYRFSQVPPGTYTVLASAQGRVWTAAMTVQVQQGMGPVRLTFEQTPYSE